MGYFWKNRRVLVTGATGFIGQWTLKRLMRAGAQVAGVARSVPECSPDGIVYHAAHVCNAGALAAVLRKNPVDTIFHLAGQPIIRTGEENPIPTLETNIQGAWTVLQAALEHNVESVVGVSSAAIYAPGFDRLCETHPLTPASSYAASKACSETLFSMYASAFRLRTAVARFANVFGGGDLNETRLIPGAIRAALNAEQFRMRRDGATTLDFLYIEDAVQALLILGEAVAGGTIPSGEAYNFGLEHPVSVVATVQRIWHLAEREDFPSVITSGASESPHSCRVLDCEKARQSLGWIPQFTFDEGLQATIDWYRMNSNVRLQAQMAGAG